MLPEIQQNKWRPIYAPRQTLVSGGFKRVSKKRPCRICGKPTYCGFSTDEGTSICMRISAGALFVGGNSFTIVFISLTFFCLIGLQASGQSMAFLQKAATLFDEKGGSWMSGLFVGVGYIIFFTSELGIIDVTSRLAAGIVHTSFNPRRLSASAL